MNLNGFDLNLLRVLDALLATGSTTEAGNRIGLSQPAVSAALSRLRDALGDPLFVRQGRGMVPTDFASSLRDPLRVLLQDTQALLSGNTVFDPAVATDTFRLSGSDFYATLLMPQLAERLSRIAPYMRVQLVDLVPDNHVQSIERYRVDLVLLPETDFPGWIDTRRVHRSRFVTIARRGHPRLRRAGLHPGDTIPVDLFCDIPQVVFSPEGNLRAMGDAALARVGRERKVAMTLPVFSGVYYAVAQSDMIALIPHQLAEAMAPRLDLDIYDPPMHVPPVAITMAWHRRSTRSPAHRWLRDQIAETLAPIDDPSVTVPFRTGGN
ncbi:LysR family transcriptional regulator [Seohaeicola saemankumensis]|nr:LysR family transcriptional regulator [Seohaeicola saemankumensis]MCA0870612.1 LysR family transcriptional regulator [Seohaeicola saemankumensis]